MDKTNLQYLVLCAVIGAVFGALITYSILGMGSKSGNQMIKEYYETEVLVGVSPASIAKALDEGSDYGVLVDLRAKSAYEAGHFRGAINIPAEELPQDQVFQAFSKLPKDKPIITYCYSSYCMLSREVGGYLAERGIYAKHMTAGWYEIQRDYSAYVEGNGQVGQGDAGGKGICPVNGSGFGC